MSRLQQSTQFLAGFYPCAKKVLYVLENIEKLSPEVFDKLQLNIELGLKEIQWDESQAAEKAAFSQPLQQLNLIAQLLPQIYQYFHPTADLSLMNEQSVG